MTFWRRLLIACLALTLLRAAAAETFLVASDLHLTGEGEQPALEALKAAEGDALILLGDNTNNSRDAEHAAVLGFLRSLDRPAFVIPGNHDLTERQPSDFTDMYADYGWDAAFSRDDGTASCAVMTPGGTCLMLLDTNAYDAPGHVKPLGGVSDATAAWVADTLDALPEGTPVIACGHHPLLPDRLSGALADALRQGGVKLYLCGHDHGFAAVNVNGLQQITVGQPQAYPGWAGRLDVSPEGFHWRTVPLYREDDPIWLAMAQSARALGENMARGVLAGTVWEDDGEAVRWFCEAFDGVLTSALDAATCERLLSAPGARKWREIETKTVVKKWIFSILESCPQDVRDIRG